MMPLRLAKKFRGWFNRVKRFWP